MFRGMGEIVSKCRVSLGEILSTSAKYPVSASSAVCRMVLRNVSDQMLCNVAGRDSEMVRNVAEQVSSELVRDVSGQVSNVAGFTVRNVADRLRNLLRNVSDQLRIMLCNVA